VTEVEESLGPSGSADITLSPAALVISREDPGGSTKVHSALGYMSIIKRRLHYKARRCSMSAASNRISRAESHDLAARRDVAEPADQHEYEQPDDGEEDHAAPGHPGNRGHGRSTQSLSRGGRELITSVAPGPNAPASTSQQPQSQESLRLDFAPDLAAWDTRTSYINPSSSFLLPPADFKPFFTLIEDPTTGEYHHPNVHYIFSDDEDQGAITSEALAILDREDNTAHQDDKIEERVVLLDMEADGKTVASAASLSADWQAIQTEITKAPSWGESQQGAERGLMLKVSVKEMGNRDIARNVDITDLEGLVARFGRQLESLDEVLGKEDMRMQSEAPSVVAQSQRAGSRAE